MSELQHTGNTDKGGQEKPKLPEEQTQQYEALDSLGIVVGEIAHDFNNILSLIFGYVEIAMSEIPEGERARSDLEHVLAAGDRAKELVARILTFSNRSKLKREEIDIDKPVQDAVKYMKDRIPGNISFNFTQEKGRAIILSNRAEIYQLVTNLCNNSIQAIANKKSESQGNIEVSLTYFTKDADFAREYPGLTADDYAKITVSDNGCGMDLFTQENMYVPFFTTARRDEENENRAGLGLTTVENIVSSLGGVIIVDSTKDEGTRFEICLPLLEFVSADRDSRPGQAEAAEKKGHILFIDDEQDISEMANHILTKHGFDITIFNDGNEALEHYSKNPHQFDLVITDLIMPVISGTELAAKINALNPNIPIILTTGFSEKITAASCDQWGINKVINKPFSINELITSINELLPH